MPFSKRLTTKEVARLCSVSDATVKRWDDAGALQSERTNGGHRRFRPEVVARFQKENLPGLKLEPGDESVTKAAARKRKNKSHSDCTFFHALAAGCEEEAAGILINTFLQNESLPEIFDQLVSPAMRRIGELWLKGDVSVAEEHLATRTVFCALAKLRSVVPIHAPNGKTAVCMAIEGDFHEIPTCLAQMTLENKGWEVINYGCNLPLYSLADEISRHFPLLICISATVIPDIERLSYDYRDFREKILRMNARVLLGGRGFSDTGVRKRFPSEFYSRNFSELSEVARGPLH